MDYETSAHISMGMTTIAAGVLVYAVRGLAINFLDNKHNISRKTTAKALRNAEDQLVEKIYLRDMTVTSPEGPVEEVHQLCAEIHTGFVDTVDFERTRKALIEETKANLRMLEQGGLAPMSTDYQNFQAIKKSERRKHYSSFAQRVLCI